MEPLSYAERFILMQALIVRRVPRHTKITPELLLKALRADNELVQERTPELYYEDAFHDIKREVDVCIEEELIEDSLKRRVPSAKSAIALRRTPHGDRFLNSLGPKLEEALDSMPMSDVGVLDFLSLL